jgi:hypothetical protein
MFIPDPNFSIPDPGSRVKKIPDPESGSALKNLSIFNPFLSSRKYDAGCSSRIQILIFYPSRISDPGVKKAPDPGSGFAILAFANPIFLVQP